MGGLGPLEASGRAHDLDNLASKAFRQLSDRERQALCQRLKVGQLHASVQH